MSYRYVYSLPWPPSVNALYRNAKRTLLTARARRWKTEAAYSLQSQKRPAEPLAGPLAIDLLLMRPNKRRFDVDNYAKVVIDALHENRVIAEDHWQVLRSMSVTVGDQDEGNGCVIVDIRPMARLYRRGESERLWDQVIDGDVPR